MLSALGRAGLRGLPASPPPHRETPGPAAYLRPGTGSRARGSPAGWGAPEEDEEGILQPRGVRPSSAELDKSGIKTTGEI